MQKKTQKTTVFILYLNIAKNVLCRTHLFGRHFFSLYAKTPVFFVFIENNENVFDFLTQEKSEPFFLYLKNTFLPFSIKYTQQKYTFFCKSFFCAKIKCYSFFWVFFSLFEFFWAPRNRSEMIFCTKRQGWFVNSTQE